MIMFILMIGVVLAVSTVLFLQFDEAFEDYQRASASALQEVHFKQLEHQGQTLAEILAQSLVNPLYELDMESIGMLLRTAVSQHDIVYAMVYDAQGRIIHDGKETLPGFGKTTGHQIVEKSLQEKSVKSKIEDNHLDLATPIFIGEGVVLGGILIGVSLEEMQKTLAQSNKRLESISSHHSQRNIYAVLLLGIALSGIGILAATLVANHLTSPIGKLARLAERIGAHDYRASSQIDRPDEIGDLAHALEKMGRQLEKTTISKEYLDEILFSMKDALLVTDRQGIIKRVNRAFSNLTGYNEDELLESPLSLVLPAKSDQLEWYELILEQEDVNAEDATFIRRDGSEVPVLLSAAQLSHSQHHQGMVFVAQDMTERHAAAQQIHNLAYFDLVTGLPNRALFIDRLNQMLQLAAREKSRLALMFLDLDRFKNINDTLGHQVGDRLLKAVAERFQNAKRAADTVARFGGDEFTFVIPDIHKTDDIITLAEKILALFQRPFQIDDYELFAGTSIGISIFPDDAENAESLIRHADIAMYRSKEKQSNGFEFYTADMNIRATEFLRLEHGLRRALDNAEFELCYQPQINLTSGRVEAVEALLRWRQLDGSMQLPDSFLPVMEETGLVVPVGEWVLKEACQQMVQWHATGLAPDHVAVNLSGRQLSTPGLVRLIEETLEQSGLSPEYLMLEITESSLMQDTDRAIDQLTQLSAMGIKLAIDDFGTGYSSLEHLQRFPIHILKIDRSFVQNMEINKDRAAIVTAIISLARIMELEVVAEGVETEHQKMLLDELGCDLVQGFLFGDAVAGSEIKFSNAAC